MRLRRRRPAPIVLGRVPVQAECVWDSYDRETGILTSCRREATAAYYPVFVIRPGSGLHESPWPVCEEHLQEAFAAQNCAAVVVHPTRGT